MAETDRDKLEKLLDFHLQLDDPSQRIQTQKLLAQDAQAQKLNQLLEQNFGHLSLLDDVEPPKNLADRTLDFIKNHPQVRFAAEKTTATQATTHSIGHSVSRDIDRSTSRSRWVLNNLRDLVAVAASVMLLFAFVNPGLKHARQVAQQQNCANQLRQAGMALNQYSLDNSGGMPFVKRSPQARWLPVGQADEQNGANTRNYYLLVKQGYIKPGAFLCPGVDHNNIRFAIKVDPENLKFRQDFAGDIQVNYSFRLILHDQPLQDPGETAIPIASDRNPIFANFDSQTQQVLDLNENEILQNANSLNHGGRGQNLLYSDGRVEFSPSRVVGINPDDIFTIRSVTRYRGTEKPQSKDDLFIAP